MMCLLCLYKKTQGFSAMFSSMSHSLIGVLNQNQKIYLTFLSLSILKFTLFAHTIFQKTFSRTTYTFVVTKILPLVSAYAEKYIIGNKIFSITLFSWVSKTRQSLGSLNSPYKNISPDPKPFPTIGFIHFFVVAFYSL